MIVLKKGWIQRRLHKELAVSSVVESVVGSVVLLAVRSMLIRLLGRKIEATSWVGSWASSRVVSWTDS